MKLSNPSSPTIQKTFGATTVSSQEARAAAIAKFSQAAPTQGSPADPNATLTPQVAPELPQSTTIETQVEQPEASVAATPEAPAPAQPVSEEAKKLEAHYANLARKEKILRMREQQLRQKMREAPAAQATPQAPQFDPSKFVNRDELINNPIGVLNSLGLTYEQLTQKVLDGPSHEDLENRRKISALEAEIASLKSGQDEVKKTFEQTQTAARQQAELQLKQDVNRLVQNDPAFEVIKAQRASNEVVKLIADVFDKGMGNDYPPGTILDLHEAAMMVEEELTHRALEAAKLKKIQSQLNSNNTAQKPQPQSQQPTQQSQLRTLTNSVGTTTRKLTVRERALAAFRGEVV